MLCINPPRDGQWSSLEVGTMMVTACVKVWTMVSDWKLGQRWSLLVSRFGQWSVTGSWDNDGHCLCQGWNSKRHCTVHTDCWLLTRLLTRCSSIPVNRRQHCSMPGIHLTLGTRFVNWQHTGCSIPLSCFILISVLSVHGYTSFITSSEELSILWIVKSLILNETLGHCCVTSYENLLLFQWSMRW